MSRLSEISFEPLEPYDGKLSCTVLRGERGSNAPDLPDSIQTYGQVNPIAGVSESFKRLKLFVSCLETKGFIPWN